MTSLQIFLIVSGIALALALGLLWYLRRQNPFFRVPIWRVGLFFAYGALFAPAAILAGYAFVRPAVFVQDTALSAFAWIGPTEELAKALGPVILVGIVRPWRKEPFEWMLACAASGVGFAMSENILYAMTYPETFEILALRSLALMHLSWSAFIGYRIGCRQPGRWKFVKAAVGAWLFASFLHGLYDAMCFAGAEGLVWTLIGLYLFGFMWRIKRMSWLCANRSPRRPEAEADWGAATREASTTLSCASCRRPLESMTLRGISVVVCPSCGVAAVGRRDLFQLMSEYSGTTGWFKQEAWEEFYWEDVPEKSACATCDMPAPARAFLKHDGLRVAFCGECAMATVPRDEIGRLIRDYRERIKAGFRVTGDVTDL